MHKSQYDNLELSAKLDHETQEGTVGILIQTHTLTYTQTYLNEQADGDEDGEYEHPTEAIKVQSASTGSVHEGDGHQRHHHHDGADPQGGVLGLPLLQASRGEQGGGVVEDLQQGGRR